MTGFWHIAATAKRHKRTLAPFFQSALGQKASAFSVRAWNCYTWNCLESKYHFIYVWQYTCTTRMPMLQATWESLFYVQRTGQVLGYVLQPREQGLRSQTYIIAPQLFHVAIRTTPCCQLQTWKMLQLQTRNHNPHIISLILNSTCPNQSFDRLYSWPVKPLRYHLAWVIRAQVDIVVCFLCLPHFGWPIKLPSFWGILGIPRLCFTWIDHDIYIYIYTYIYLF